MRLPALSFPLLIACAAPVGAQQAPDIVVTGRPLPDTAATPAYGSVTIERERLTTNAGDRLETVLADIAGVQQFRRSDSRSANPSAQGVTLRALGGNATSRALVLLDGVPVADPFFGFVPWNALVPDSLARVTVTRGAGSGPFGAGAVAGVIALDSAGPGELPGLRAAIDGGSFNAQSLSGGVARRMGGGFASASGRWERSDGFFTTPPDQRVAATARAAYQDWSAGLRGIVSLGRRTELQARLALFRDMRTLRFAGADSFSEGQDASLRLVHRGRWQVEALAYLQARDFGNRVISSTSFRLTLDQRRTPATGLGGKIELRPPVGGGHALRLGLDYRGARGTLYEDGYAATGAVTARRTAGGRQDMIGLFVEDDWTRGALGLTGGVRVDRWTITGGFFEERDGSGATRDARAYPARRGVEVTARGGLLLRVGGGVTMRAAGYSGFRLPTLNELYRPFVVFPVTTEANAALAPERLRGGEIGIDWRLGGLRLEVTAFDNRLAGAIGNVTIGSNRRQRQNLRAIAVRGVEASGVWQRGAWSLSASYALSDARVRDAGALGGRRPAQSPVDAASATLGWTRGGWAASATLRYVGAQFEDDLETDRLPPATTIDAVARLPLLPGVALMLRGENLADARVVTRNSGGSVDLGTPRILWLGLRFAT